MRFTAPATTRSYTLSLHDALPIWPRRDGRRDRTDHGRRRYAHTDRRPARRTARERRIRRRDRRRRVRDALRSEEHTSELQSPCNLVCRLLLEKEKAKKIEEIYVRW